ncbi:MAG TPA: hypothetical protein VD907_00410 [Verrucomicrobiae bacterium]|nr:hypothetical protein [Verrucomicrobiae bacterium]
MYIWLIVALVGFAALLHAGFQLGVSLLMLLSSHSIGAKRPATTTAKLVLAYLLGVVVTTALLFSALGYFATLFFSAYQPAVTWLIIAALNVTIGGSVMLFYFRKGTGTELWLPRKFAEYLVKRAKAARQAEEAFTLGVMSVLTEIGFIIAPLSVAVLAVASLTGWEQLVGLIGYVLLASLPLLIIAGLIGAGHKVSGLQRWREQNKRFLQYAAGSGLVVLGLYIFISEVVSQVALEGVPLL